MRPLFDTDCSLGSNPSQPPLVRGGASFALPMIRGSWRGFGSNGFFGVNKQAGFTLVEMIMVIVITGIIGGIVAVFLKAPIQQYMDVARRAELTDIADTAVRRMARDVRIAVPNSVRPDPAGLYVEFLPTKDGGRYRADSTGGAGGCAAVAGDTGGDALNFAASDTCFEIIGFPIPFAAGDQIVVGSTQSDGQPPYADCTLTPLTCIRRAYNGAVGTGAQIVVVTSTTALPAFAELPSQRFDVVDGTQQAVTYACVGTLGTLDANQNGQGQLMRYWWYGFYPTQQAPPITVQAPVPPNAGAVRSAILADNVSDCEITYDVPNQRFGLLAVRLTLTSGGESVSLYNEIHVNNAP